MSDVNRLKNLFSEEYPSVVNHDEFKIVGPVNLPTRLNSQKLEMNVYLFSGKNEKYLVCILGNVEKVENIMVRISSACVFGFILNSMLCDCRDQFDEALVKMEQKGAGIMIYCMDQHGKGIGIDAHFLVYSEGQRRDKGLFYEIYKDLGIKEDYRDYEETIDILKYLKDKHHFKKLTFLTEAPNKRKYYHEKANILGIDVDFETFETKETPENKAELTEKKMLGYKIAEPIAS